jgi:hypothetical protein
MGHARDLIMLAQGGVKRKVGPGDPLQSTALVKIIFWARRSRDGVACQVVLLGVYVHTRPVHAITTTLFAFREVQFDIAVTNRIDYLSKRNHIPIPIFCTLFSSSLLPHICHASWITILLFL